MMFTSLRSFPTLAVLLALLLPLCTTAQSADWDVYTTHYKKGPVTILLDMSLKRSAPVATLPFVVITGALCKNCDNNGMPMEKEFPELYRISDTVQSKLNKLTENRLAGTLTYACERLDYFYVADTTGLRERINKMYDVYFPTYKPRIIIRGDFEWKAYLDILYPKEEEQERMANQKVLAQLKEAGDKLTKERLVTHWIFFTKEAARTCFMDYASKEGFVTDPQNRTLDNEHLFALRIARPDKVDLNSITKITLALRRQLKICNGRYQGWEAPVVK